MHLSHLFNNKYTVKYLEDRKCQNYYHKCYFHLIFSYPSQLSCMLVLASLPLFFTIKSPSNFSSRPDLYTLTVSRKEL